MKLTTQVKLQLNTEQHQALLETLQAANAACNRISDYAWNNRTFSQYKLHYAVYHRVRNESGLSSQIIIRCLAKVADAYKLDKKTKRQFQPTGSIAYDVRILRWLTNKWMVSIWTIQGRKLIPFTCGEHQKRLLESQKGEADLVYRNGEFYLFATCDVQESELFEPVDFLGVDLGIVNIAVDSDGQHFTGNKVNNLRHRHRRLRAKLQSKGTKSARRLLKQRRRKERRFATNTNHIIAKQLVAKAQCTNRAIVLEDLNGIRSRTKVKKPQRATHSSWAFFQLRQFIAYKAQLLGVPVILVDPKNTSRECPQCGYVSKLNRPNQSTFKCKQCEFAGSADYIAATIISRRGSVNSPNVVAAYKELTTSPRSLVVGI